MNKLKIELFKELEDEWKKDPNYGYVWDVIYNKNSIGTILLQKGKYAFCLSNASDPTEFEFFFRSLQAPEVQDLIVLDDKSIKTAICILQEVARFCQLKNAEFCP